MNQALPAGCLPAHPLFTLDGRVIVITGAGQGLGRAYARHFALAGARVAVVDINADKAQSVADEIRQSAGEAIALVADLASADAAMAMAAQVIAHYGQIDALINNAAIFSTLAMRPFEDIPLDEWRRVLAVNIDGVYHGCRAVVGAMKAAGRGRIVNIGSSAVTLGRGNYLHYTTSKSALVGMSRSLARELGPHGITVNTLLPGPTFTEIERATVTPEQKQRLVAQQCIPRPAAPEDMIGTVMFLVSDAAAFMTGQALTVDGGMTHP